MGTVTECLFPFASEREEHASRQGAHGVGVRVQVQPWLEGLCRGRIRAIVLEATVKLLFIS